METNERERAAVCALNRIFGYEPAVTHRLIDVLGSAAALFDLDANAKRDLLGPFSKHLSEIRTEELDRSAEELRALGCRGYRFLCVTEEGYPPLLKECEDAPAGLYIRSDSPDGELFRPGPYIAVVGTRDISLYGRDACRRIVEALSRSRTPPVIVSGFALGTDIIAHAVALECGLRTLAVLPTGITDVYPRRHWKWADRLAATPGCALLTDYPPGTEALPLNFLRRNRIIAGLSQATVLIESKAKGGGLITAEFAFGYDREVFALPGRMDDLRSQGCNALIKRGLAQAITDPDALLADLGLDAPARRTAALLRDEIRERYAAMMNPGEVEFLVAVADCIRKNRGITPEDIALRMNCDTVRIAAATGILEADGIIETDLLQGCGIRTKIG